MKPRTQPRKASVATVSVLIAASLALLPGLAMPAGADAGDSLQDLRDRCVHINAEGTDPGPICVPNLGEVCAGTVSCTFEADPEADCVALCQDQDGPDLSFTPFEVDQPGIRAWVSNCEVATVTTFQVTLGDEPGCPIGNTNNCNSHSPPTEELLPVCWEVLIVEEDTHTLPQPGVDFADEAIPLSMGALCFGQLWVSVGPQPILNGSPAVAPCSSAN